MVVEGWRFWLHYTAHCRSSKALYATVGGETLGGANVEWKGGE
jgi:hypothetical protein